MIVYYSLMMIFMIFLNVIRRKKYEYSLSFSVIYSLVLLILGVISAFIMYYLESGFTQFVGVSFYGCLIICPFMIIGYAILTKQEKIKLLSFSAIPICVCITILKIQCFNDGCCVGITLSWFDNGRSLFPVQLLESVISFNILIVLLWIEDYLIEKDDIYKLFPIYLLCYGITRFLVEFLRDSPKDKLAMSNGQLWSVLVVMVGISTLIYLKKNKNNYFV